VATADGATDDYGPWDLEDLGSNAAADGITVTPGGAATGVFFRVTGTAGDNKVYIRVYDNETVVLTDAANSDGSSLLKVDADVEFSLNLFDGDPYDGAGATAKNPNNLIAAYNDTDGDWQYGEDVGDLLQTANDWDNFLCAGVTTFTGTKVDVSFDSGGISGDDFITFVGQDEIAHLDPAEDINLEACTKVDLYGYVDLSAQQGATCAYQYDAPTGTGYCADVGTANFAAAGGNRAIIEVEGGTFGTNSDRYRLVLRITSGSGTYFAGLPLAVDGLLPSNTTNPCLIAPGGGNVSYAPGWTITTETMVAAGVAATGVGCGSLAATEEWVTLTSAQFGPFDTCNRILVDIPTLVYDPSLLSDGDMATVEIELQKVPCGVIFTGSRNVAQYVSACPAAAGATVLLFPYATPLDGHTGWWFGMSFCNAVLPTTANVPAAAGSYTITMYEADGDSFQYSSTEDLAAGDMITLGTGDLLGLTWTTLTSTGGGIAGDSRCHFVVNCLFGPAGGFGMMGNGRDSTGYVAYGSNAFFNY
jgi:hypothetical protein